MATWTKQSLFELGEVNRGKSKHRPRNDAVLYGGKYPFIQTSDIKHSNFYITKHEQTYNEEGLKQSKLWPKGTLCITIAANIAESGILSYPACFPDSVVGFVANQKKSNTKFVKYALDFAKQNFQKTAKGTAQDNLSLEKIKSIKIDAPEVSEQNKIADVISAYDSLIENNNRRIKILEEMAQRLYTEWFVKFNLPAEVLTKAGFPDGKLKMIDSGTKYSIIPEGWAITKLGNKIKIRKGKNITKGTITHGVVPVIAGGLNAAYCHNKVNTKWPVVTISASGANAGFVNLHYEDVWASDCSYIDSNVTRNVYFHYLYLKNKNKEIKNLQRGAAQPHVYPKDLMTLSIIDYPEALIDNFQREVNKLFVLIGNVKNKNRVLTKIRDLLILQIITGKRALK